MELTNNPEERLNSDLNTHNLIPLFQTLNNHFLLADKLELTPLAVMKDAENSWKEIENFEFQKMDIGASFEQLIKRI